MYVDKNLLDWRKMSGVARELLVLISIWRVFAFI